MIQGGTAEKKTSRFSIANTVGKNKKLSEKCRKKTITLKQNEQKCFDHQQKRNSSDWKEIMNRNVSHKYSYFWHACIYGFFSKFCVFQKFLFRKSKFSHPQHRGKPNLSQFNG